MLKLTSQFQFLLWMGLAFKVTSMPWLSTLPTLVKIFLSKLVPAGEATVASQVLGLAGIVVETTCNAVLQQTEVKTDIPGGSGFPLQAGDVGFGAIRSDVIGCQTGASAPVWLAVYTGR